MAEHRKMIEAETDANKRSKWTEKMDRWNKALTEVAGLKGNNVNGRVEKEFIKEIVKDVYHRLQVSLRNPLPLLIGMDRSIEFVTSWLDKFSYTTDVLTILGMGGIGKTSLAKYVYGLRCHKFKRSNYIGNISRKCEQNFTGLLLLQKQLYDDISRTSSIEVNDVSIYTSMIENVVSHKQVFLVLDDIDSLVQLDSMLGSKGFYLGSKIIVTTKDAWLTKSCVLFKKKLAPKHTTHLLNVLKENDSHELLCFHAFNSNHPKAGYKEVSNKFVKYCEGHPLALEVLGKSLYNRDVAYWEDVLEQLEKETGSPIDNVLKMSLDSLSSKNDKDLFKHIACYFVGTNRDVSETILKACRINTTSGITNLMDRCLLSIGENNEFMMHQLLQKMGRFLVYQESPEKPWKRSRLWFHEDSFKVLKQKKGKGNLLGLALDMRMLKKGNSYASFKMETNALSNMENLMLLQLNYVQFSGSYENFPDELRWLCMHGFPLKSIPSDLPMENLVALDMSYSSIESLGICYSNPQLESRKKLIESCSKDKSLLGSLKILNLSFCEQLRSLGSFEKVPSLEMLILTNCIGLLEVCDSIMHCVELAVIDMSYCNNLDHFPRTLHMLKKVKTLLLVGCNSSKSRIEIRDIVSPGIPTESLIVPRDFKLLSVSLPRSLVRLSLANNDLATESFPTSFVWLSMLKDLNLDENPMISMPVCVRSLPSLESLSMKNCKMLTSVERPPHTLTYLDLYLGSKKAMLRKIVFDPKVTTPLQFSIDWRLLASSSFEFEGLIKIQPIASIEKKLLRSLGWIDLDFLNERRLVAEPVSKGREESKTQMYYEFGIFSTIYVGKEIPDWITCKRKGPSISFIIPSSLKQFRGLNFCYVLTSRVLNESLGIVEQDQVLDLPMIIISNITKKHTWIYHHYVYRVRVDGDFAIMLSHWMFGMNEMEGGDEVTIATTQDLGLTEEVGVGFMYDDGNTDEEDALGYYKSWNHIIGGDLLGFQTTTGEYILNSTRFLSSGRVVFPYYLPYIGDEPYYKENQVHFRVFSVRKSNIVGGVHEDETVLYNRPSKMLKI
ncbi:unnamed protein product [Lactuca saligna]|uniref:NB-ARC domain-containing protein n=1 Tax=Lactuca saligna TaxID=75948 RepID=A0AA35YDJ0_LACSI|nr:unnamed protein product [Lactuca saligna]